MSERPVRIVDAHVHLWDPANTVWYPYLSGQQDIGMATAGMARRFDVATHRAESEGWNVVGLVNVAAATGAHSVAETLSFTSLGDGPQAVVGGLPPGDVGTVVAAIDEQMANPRFVGARPMGGSREALPDPSVLAALAERDLVFDLMAHPHQLVEAARGIEAVDGLAVVVEHTGWPRSDTPEERALWEEGMAALAAVGDRVVCKLSGLAMPLRSLSVEAFRPWVAHALGLFGADRCLFASNFPVDGMVGPLDQLLEVYATLLADLSPADQDAVWAATAARTYRLAL